MKALLALLVLLGVSVALAADAEEQLSASGNFHARAELPQGTRYLVLLLTHVPTENGTIVFTRESGSWAIVWTISDVLLLIATQSHDHTPIRAYELKGDQFVERAPTRAEILFAYEAYEKKHGKKYEPNQALQHNDHVRHGSCSEQHAPRQP